MPLCVLIIDNPVPAHQSRHQDVAHIARALALATQAISGGAGNVTSGVITDTGAKAIGSWFLEAAS